MKTGNRSYKKKVRKQLTTITLCAALVMSLLQIPTGIQPDVFAAGEMKAFPQQVSYPGIIKPNHVSQSVMNKAVSDYYDYWKATYLKSNLSSLPGGYYVKGNITGGAGGYTPLGSSEGQGYGMVITVLMAGYDSNAKTIYDGLFKTARAFKSSINSNLMGWVVADATGAQGSFSSATDGDIDIAYSLILAHNQWGSNGSINYLEEAKKMITNGIKASNVTTNNRLNLGDWDAKSALNTRPSDWMLSHLRAFYDVTGDQTWINVINNLYSVYTQFSNAYSSTTGLISDFVVDNPPKPAPQNYLNEFPQTNEYYYNASRVPLRIVMDYALYGDIRGKNIADKMTTWIKGKTSNNPANIRDGYKMDGTTIGSYGTAVFTSPFISSGVASSSNQAWVNAGWDWMKNKKENYFSDSFNMLNLLFISGNWWKPSSMPVPGSLPAPWVTQDIGSPAVAGSATHNAGTFTVKGAGADIWDTSDQFRYVYQSLQGDGTIIARISGQQNTNEWAKAGVMIRESLNANAKHADMLLTPSNGYTFQHRSSTGGATTTLEATSGSSTWVKLERTGNVLKGSYSTNGTSWTTLTQTTISMSSNVYIGLAVSSHNIAQTSQVTFDNLTITKP